MTAPQTRRTISPARRRLLTGAIAPAALAAVAISAGGCVAWHDSHLEKEARTISAPYSPAATLRVETANGRISVEKGGGDAVTIVAELRARTVERLAATQVFAEMVGDELVVRVEWPEGGRLGNEGCTFEIITPGVDGFRLVSSNGRITATGLAGEGWAETSNGSIQIVDHSGPVHAETSNGSVTLERIAGEVNAESSNGRISVLDTTGAVDAATSNGSVQIRFVDGADGPFRVHTSNGSVTIMLGDGFDGRIDMDTNNGRVNVDPGLRVTSMSMSKESGVVVVGEGGSDSNIRTSNGSIRVTSASGRQN